MLTSAIGVEVRNENPYFLTYLLVKLILFSKNDIADTVLDDIVFADKSPLCTHEPKLFILPLASELIFIVFPTAASIYKLFRFVIIWHVDISVKELVGLFQYIQNLILM